MPGRIRTLKPELLEDAIAGEIDDRGFRLYVALILMADDYGNVENHPPRIGAQVWWSESPWAREGLASIRETLAVVASAGLVRRYEHSGRPYIHVAGWEEHQKVDRPSKPRFPMHNDKGSTWVDPPRDGLASESRGLAGDSTSDPIRSEPIRTEETREGVSIPSEGDLRKEHVRRAQAIWNDCEVARSEVASVLGQVDGGRARGLTPRVVELEDCGLLDAVAAYSDDQLRHHIACLKARALRDRSMGWFKGGRETWSRKVVAITAGTTPEAIAAAPAESRGHRADDGHRVLPLLAGGKA